MFGGGTRPDPAYAPARPPDPPVLTQPDGSIYEAGYELRLFEDYRAHKVGDILTVMLVETTDASKSASTKASKSTSMDIQNPTLFGQQAGLANPVNLGITKLGNLAFNSDTSHDFSGSGSSTQSNSLQGTIAVVVSEVLANGNLIVQGEKIIALNQGDEFVRLSGIVRPRDISANNTILSTQVANAHISYGGKGTINSANILGWLAKFFLTFWPL